MPKTRNELLRTSAEWTERAKNDIRAQIEKFIEQVETTEDELAYALGISEDEMANILHGDGDISLSTFAKILIASEHALAIQPIGETPMGDYDHPMPRARRVPPMERPETPHRHNWRDEEERNDAPRRNWRDDVESDDFDDEPRGLFEGHDDFVDPESPEWTPPTDRFGNPLPVPTDPDGNPLPSPRELRARGIDPLDFIRGLAEREMGGAPRPGRRPAPVAVDAPDDREMGGAPHPDEEPEPEVVQPRGKNGRFMPWPKSTAPREERKAPRELSELSWGELSDLVRKNLWDGEINLHTASHKELVDFLTEKESRLKAQHSDDVTDEFKEAVLKACDGKPELLEQFEKLFPKG